MVKLVRPVDLSFADLSEHSVLKLEEVTSKQMVRDWHSWLGSTFIKKPKKLNGDTYYQTTSVIELLSIDAVDSDAIENTKLKQCVEKLVEWNKKLSSIATEKARYLLISVKDEKRLKNLEDQEREFEIGKRAALKEVKENFELKYLTIDMLKAFWGKHLVPKEQKKHADQYTNFLARYAHHETLNIHKTSIADSVAKKGAENCFKWCHLSEFEITVSDTELTINSKNRFEQAQIFDKDNKQFYRFVPAAGREINLTSSITLGIGADKQVGITELSGFGGNVTKQIRNNCLITRYEAQTSNQTKGGQPFISYFPIEHTGKPVLEIGHIICELLLRLANWIDQVSQKLSTMRNKKIEETNVTDKEQESLLPT